MEIDTLALCSAPNNSSFVGISLATAPKEPHSIFATFQHVGVHQYDLQEQRCLQSWLVPSDTTLSLAALQHPVTGDLFCVQEGSTVLSWSKSAQHVDQWRKRKFDAPVAALQFHESMKQSVVVVLTDGRAFVCTVDLSQSTPVQTSAKGAVILSQLIRASQTLYLLLLCVDTNTALHIYELSAAPPHNVNHLRSHQFPDKELSRVQASFFTFSDRQLFLLREDCSWQAWKWDSVTSLLQKHPEQCASRSLKNFAAPQQSSGKRRKSGASTSEHLGGLVAAPFRSSIVLIAGSVNSEPALTFWDTQFGALIATHSLADKKGNNAPHERIVGAVASSDHRWVVVALNARAVLCPVHCPPSSIALALGKMPATVQLAADVSAKPPVSAPIALQEQIALLLHAPATRSAPCGADVKMSDSLWTDTLCAHDKLEQETIDALRDESITSQKFNEVFTKFVNSRRKDAKPYLLEQTKKLRRKDVLKRQEYERKMQRRRREAMAEAGLSEHFVVTTGEMALRAHHWAPLEYLLKSQCLYAQTLPDLFTSLIEHKRLDLLLVALRHVPDVPEPDMVTVLRYLLSADAQTLADFLHKHRNTHGKAATRDHDAAEARAMLFAQLLRLPRNDVFLTQQLRDLSPGEVEAVMLYLSDLLESHLKGTAAGEGAATEADVLDWMCVVIDAHLPLLLAANSKWASRVDALRDGVRNEATVCDLAAPVHSFLATLASGKKLPLADVPDYRVEKLRF